MIRVHAFKPSRGIATQSRQLLGHMMDDAYLGLGIRRLEYGTQPLVSARQRSREIVTSSSQLLGRRMEADSHLGLMMTLLESGTRPLASAHQRSRGIVMQSRQSPGRRMDDSHQVQQIEQSESGTPLVHSVFQSLVSTLLTVFNLIKSI
jgi:hypothetical protein